MAPHNRDTSTTSDEALDEKRSSNTADTLHDPVQAPHGHPHQSGPERGHLLTVDNHHLPPPDEAAFSPSGSRVDANKLNDDLELLRAERVVSHQEADLTRSRSRIRHHESESDDFFVSTPPKDKQHRPMPEKRAGICCFSMLGWLKVLPRFFRYFLYMLPGASLLLIPILIGHFVDNEPPVGGRYGVELMWFGIWLMVVWCSLWGSRMVTSLMPYIFGACAVIMGSTNHKKWKDIGRSLELHAALFIWMLVVLITFRPILNSHRAERRDGSIEYVEWIDIVGKVIIALFVLTVLNAVEKVCIQWIATSFHRRTYSQRIEGNKSDIDHLVHLYEYAKKNICHTDKIWDATDGAATDSGTRTPMAALHNNVRQVVGKAGVVASRVGNDFIGRKHNFSHSRKIVQELLRTTASAHSLARLIFRSLANPVNDTIYPDDMQVAFKTPDEADHAFAIFDRDFNGDISMEELELVCNEIHLERKAIAASLKDLDSVIKKLDKVFFFIIFVVAVIVFIAILSGSAAAGLASAGSAVLGLAWMLQATAQEFLQSIIFVFVKHPFDVGDRVTVYGNTGTGLQGDDYYVTEISLLYTEFKKMEGHIVQAPNSVLNTLFILNQRRSAGLADVVELRLGFATDPGLIEELKERMLDYCLANKRDFQPRVLTEVRTLNDVQSFTMNFVFFHKSNFQNELLRLTRHNKFVSELMVVIRDLGMQGPWQVQPGGSRETPLHWASAMPPPSYDSSSKQGGPPPSPAPAPLRHTTSGASTQSRPAAMQVPKIEESLADFQDVFESRKREHTPQISRLQSIKEHRYRGDAGRESMDHEEGQAAAASGAMQRPSTESASRRHIFGRSRSKSQAKPSDFV